MAHNFYAATYYYCKVNNIYYGNTAARTCHAVLLDTIGGIEEGSIRHARMMAFTILLLAENPLAAGFGHRKIPLARVSIVRTLDGWN